MENVYSQLQGFQRRLRNLENDVEKLKSQNRAHTLKKLASQSAKSRAVLTTRRTSKRVPSTQRKSISKSRSSRQQNTGRDVILPTGEKKFVPDPKDGERIQFYDADNKPYEGTVVSTLDHDVPEVKYENKRARIYYYPDKDRYEIVR